MKFLSRTLRLKLIAPFAVAWLAAGPLSAAVLVSQYNFEGNLNDSVGGFNVTGTTGTITYDSTDPRVGASSGVFASSYASVADNASQSFTSSFSISSWFYLTSESAEQNTIAGKWGTDPNRAYALAYHTTGNSLVASRNKLTFQISTNGQSGANVSQLISTQTISLNNWYHVAAVYETNGTAATLKLYINGALDSTLNGAVTSVHNSTAPLTIGSFFDNSVNRRMNGEIDDLRLYSGALTAGEVLALATIPEPSIMMLALAGCGILVGRRRRSAQQ